MCLERAATRGVRHAATACAALAAFGLVGAVPPAHAQVLVSGVWANTLQSGEPDEAVEIWNGGATPLDASGWRVEDDDGGSVVLPSGLTVPPGGRAWITHDGAAFRLAFGEAAAAQALPTDPGVAVASGTWPTLGNAGDEVVLRDPSGAVVDAVCTDGATPTIPPWTGVGATEGWDPSIGTSALLIARNRVEGSADCAPDTDTAADWDDLRLERPGTTHLLPFRLTAPGRVRGAIGPDSTFPLFASVVDGATATLRLAFYELSSPAVVDRVVAALRRGVAVRVLLEGEPVGGRSADDEWAGAQLAAAGADVRWLRADSVTVKRYPFHHAKYAVADEATVYVATENGGVTGHPADPTFGNRGWALAVDDGRLAAWYTALFDEDSDLRHADVHPYDPMADDPPAGTNPDPTPATSWHYPTCRVFTPGDVSAVSAVVSPDHTSLRGGGILGLIAGATTTLDAEQLSVPRHWGLAADPPNAHPSALVDALVAAARRGVAVRLLLDGSWFSVDPTDPHDNDDTCAYLASVASAEGLALECRTLDPALLSLETLHVKGYVADGRVVHVGSTNGTSTSFRLNREAGIQVESPSLAGYFDAEFARDWRVAGVGAVVPAEVHDLHVVRDAGGGLLYSWAAPPAGAPDVDGYRVYGGASPIHLAGWTAVASIPAPSLTAGSALTSGNMTCFLVVAVKTGPGGDTIEGPAGHADGYFDR